MSYKNELSEELAAAIRLILGDDGWNKHGEETFYELASNLLLVGMTDDEVIEMLERTYGAVASEFGA